MLNYFNCHITIILLINSKYNISINDIEKSASVSPVPQYGLIIIVDLQIRSASRTMPLLHYDDADL